MLYIVLTLVIIFICRIFKNKISDLMLGATFKFRNDLEKMCEHYVCHSEKISFLKQWSKAYFIYSKIVFFTFGNFRININVFLNYYKNFNELIDLKNDKFVVSEKARCYEMFSNIDNKSLDDQQRTVVVTDEDNNLVLAGAGSGKTLTISAKVKYLYDEKKIAPEDILLISFTRKSAEELSNRIREKLNVPIEASTFHKLGLDILKTTSKKPIDVCDEQKLYKLILKIFENEIYNNNEMLNSLIDFFASYFYVPKNILLHKAEYEYYNVKNDEKFETLNSKHQRYLIDALAENKKKNKETIDGEIVKSFEEVIIANFLFKNGVRYVYEGVYPYANKYPEQKTYRPDFYLPDYDLYLEHFGITKNNRVPWAKNQDDEKKYLESIRWKRKVHKENKTKLIETYSYYSNGGKLEEKLDKILRNNGVVYKKRDLSEIYGFLKKDKHPFYEFIKLCATFITLYKSNGYELTDLEKCFCKSKTTDESYSKKRVQLFREIISPIISAYENYLKENNCIDFSDMINNATKAVKSGFLLKRKYKYIIIDEFQDISVARYKLIKAIQEQTGAKTVCVGDDWQSIYRFAGSDISIFTKFEKYFGHTKVMRLENTYRNAQELIDEVGKFITKNPMQLRKSLKSSKSLKQPNQFCESLSNEYALEKIMEELISDFGPTKSILFLGRTKYDSKILEDSKLFTITNNNLIYKKSPKTPMQFLTVHKAKGLEADNVVLLNFNDHILGFPNKIADDPLLELVLGDADRFPYSEERRLLYVALTRTKNKNYIMLDFSKKPSEFFHEFVPESNYLCPICGGNLIPKISYHGMFYGCSNYYSEIICRYTRNIEQQTDESNIAFNIRFF